MNLLPLVSLPRAAGFLAGALLLTLSGCSGGKSGTTNQVTQGCGAAVNGQNQLCLTSCSLGCTSTGCSVSDIPVNQPIILNFNQRIDPATVNSSTVSLRTASGGQPVGEYVVRDQSITFVPDIRVVGNTTSFGFEPGQKYALTLPGGPNESDSIRSTSGDRLKQTVSCFLNATKGVVDLDGRAPEATLIAPLPDAKSKIPNLTTFVIEFSELIDTAPFQGANPSNGPVTFTLYQTQRDTVGNLICLTKAYEISGKMSLSSDRIRQRTSLTMQPENPLPSEVCVVVEVTNRVRDLSNKPVVRAIYRMFTHALPPVVTEITENFLGTAKMDTLNTGAFWGSGKLEPGLIGLDGVHGEFVASDGRFLGESNGVRTYEWSTVSMTIPARRTYRNRDLRATNGSFSFSSFVINANERVVWEKGNQFPVMIFVRGKVRILGTMDVSGTNTPGAWDGKAVGTSRGEPGSTGGPMGGVGGTGGDRPAILGGSINGRPGADVNVGQFHPYYATRIGTGGGGSPCHPPNATLPLQYCYLDAFSQHLAPGGSGGSLFEDELGVAGKVIRRNTNCTNGADGTPGTAFQLLPEQPSFGSRTLYMIGGSGGGGGGINPYFNAKNQTVVWNTGAAGAGGGGVMVLRVGGDVEVASTGKLISRGGSAGDPTKSGYATPGGGGSGGSILIQCGSNNYVMGGTIDVKGGTGGAWEDSLSTPGFGFLRTEGGRGGAGYARVEAVPAPSASNAGLMLPPASAKNVGLLVDRDFVSGAQSLWYHTGKTFPPKYLRYEIEVEINGQPKKYSDDPRFGIMPDFDPIDFYIQGAQVSQRTLEPDQPTIGLWTNTVKELETQSPTGFRWIILFNREYLAPNTTLVVKKVKVVVEG